MQPRPPPADDGKAAWLRQNSTLFYFLVAQFIAMGAGAASVLAYMVKLETRVYTMETRGAEYTVARMDELKLRIAQQEQEVFGRIAESRAKMAGARTPEERMAAANDQSSALARLLVVSENYPQLRSSETFNRLMDELSGTENRIAVERMRYNERVQQYNTTRRSFPSNITAGLFGFKEYQPFDAPPAAEQVPRVNFGKPGA